MQTLEQQRRRHHNKHSRHRGQYPCFYCGKEEADCKRKLRFTTVDECLDWVREFNATHDYEVTAYFCRFYCRQWHYHTNRSKGAPPAPRTKAGQLFPDGSRVTVPNMENVTGTILMECTHCPGVIVQWDEGPVSHERFTGLIPALEGQAP